MELTTGLLTQEQMQAELNAILSLVADSQSRDVEIIYGFSCDVEETYQSISVSVSALPTFISQGWDEGIWQLGKDDFYITTLAPSVQYLLCHESDVHITTAVPQVLHYFTSRWIDKCYKPYRRINEHWEPLVQSEPLPSQ